MGSGGMAQPDYSALPAAHRAGRRRGDSGVTDPQLAEVPLRPGREVFPQPPHQARHRILRQRRATVQGK